MTKTIFTTKEAKITKFGIYLIRTLRDLPVKKSVAPWCPLRLSASHSNWFSLCRPRFLALRFFLAQPARFFVSFDRTGVKRHAAEFEGGGALGAERFE